MTDENERDEAVPLNSCTPNCGYRVEGELPEKCPECGADREQCVTPNATTPVLTLTSVYAMSQ